MSAFIRGIRTPLSTTSIPASFRISHTVEAATCTPTTSSSPWTRR
ncbi:hypothetical protein [Streptomyces sp. MNU89]